jgi:hypothetical protein
MIARQLGVQARYEVEHQIERIQRGKQQAAAQGRWLGGVRPFGFEGDGVTIRESEAEEIRTATHLILGGASIMSLVRDWNRRGVRTSKGKAWQGTEVRRVLMRPRNAGLMLYQGNEVGPAMWDGIVEEPTWRAVVQLLEDPSRRTTPSNERRWLGSGLYRCGLCANTVRVAASSVSAGGVIVASYRCRARTHLTRQAAILDEFVSEVVVGRLERPDAVELLRTDKSRVDVVKVQAALLAARVRLDEVAAMFGAGDLDAAQTRRATEAARAQMRVAENALAEAAKVNPLVGVVGAPSVREVWGELDLSRKRAVMDAVVEVVVHPARKGRLPGGLKLDPDAIEFRWRQ